MTEKTVFRASRILTKQATHGPESKLLETSDREKTQIASYGRAFNCVDVICPAKKISLQFCTGTAFPFLSNVVRVKN